MFGTNKLYMKGIYLPTFQRSIILRANEGYKNYSLTTFGGKNLFHYLCLYIYNIQILYKFSLLFRQIKRQDAVHRLDQFSNIISWYCLPFLLQHLAELIEGLKWRLTLVHTFIQMVLKVYNRPDSNPAIWKAMVAH